MRCPVEEKGNVPLAEDATGKTPYTKRAFSPLNIILMGRGFI